MMPKTITPDEARARFGELRAPGSTTYSEFVSPEGIWRPEFGPGMVLTRYRLYPPVKAVAPVQWRFKPKPKGRGA